MADRSDLYSQFIVDYHPTKYKELLYGLHSHTGWSCSIVCCFNNGRDYTPTTAFNHVFVFYMNFPGMIASVLRNTKGSTTSSLYPS